MQLSLVNIAHKTVLYLGLSAIAIGEAKAQDTNPQINSIVNTASYQQLLNEGGLVTIFGSNFAAAPCGATTLPFPATLCGVSVDVDGVRAPVIYADAKQLNVQMPYGVGDRKVKVIKTVSKARLCRSRCAIARRASSCTRRLRLRGSPPSKTLLPRSCLITLPTARRTP